MSKEEKEEAKKASVDVHSQKCQKAEALVTERKEKALQHNEQVANKVKETQLLREERQEGMKVKLERKASKDTTERKEKAYQHNEKVAERVRNAQQQREERQENIRAKLELKKGSKVSGEFFSRVSPAAEKSPPASPESWFSAASVNDVELEC